MCPENGEKPGNRWMGEPRAPYCSTWLALLLRSVLSGHHQLAHHHPAQRSLNSHRDRDENRVTHNVARGAGSSLGSHGTRLTLQEGERGRNNTETDLHTQAVR